MAKSKLLMEEVSNWSGGVITNARPDLLLRLSAFPRGRNTQLFNIGGGTSVIATRPGITMMNSTKITGGGTVLGQFQYRRYSGGAFTTQHLIVTSTGRLKVMNDTDGTLSDADGGAPTPFSSGQFYLDSQVANNVIYMVNGQENKKYNGTNVQAVGFAAPSAPGAVDSGVAGNPNGTYEFLTTYYNSATGQESSASASTSVTVANKKITVSWSNSADSQVDTTRIYIRKGTLNGNFFRLTAGVTPAVNGNGGFPNATTSATVDVTDAQINALTTLAPTTTENNPPPVLDRIQFHQGRLFGVAPSDPSTLLFGKLSTEGLESFNPSYSIPVNVKDGDRITALESAHELLIIFKSRSIYILVGTYPDWELRLLTNELGSVNHLSCFTYSDKTYFWSQLGPVVWQPGNAPTLLAQPNLANKVSSDVLNFSILDKVAVGFDYPTQRLIWSIPPVADSRNTRILPFNTQVGVFESDQWDVIDVASIANVLDSSGNPKLYFGDYNARIFRFDGTDVYTDGVPSGTLTGTGGTTSYGATTLTDTAASFYTTGDGLADLYVYVYDANGQNLGRRRISSNTSTALTIASAWDTTPNSSWTYVIGGIDFEIDVGWSGMGNDFWKKNYEHLLIDIVPPSTNATIYCELFTDFATAASRVLTFRSSTSGSLWGSGIWDTSLWGGGLPIAHNRLRMALTGRNYLIRIRNVTANNPVAVTRVGVTAIMQTLKS